MTGAFANAISDFYAHNSKLKGLEEIEVSISHIDKSPIILPNGFKSGVEFGDVLLCLEKNNLSGGTKVTSAYVFQVKKNIGQKGNSTAKEIELYSGWPVFSIKRPEAIRIQNSKTLDILEPVPGKVKKSGFWYMYPTKLQSLFKTPFPFFIHLDSSYKSKNIYLFEDILSQLEDSKCGRELLNGETQDDWTRFIHSIMMYKQSIFTSSRYVQSVNFSQTMNFQQSFLQQSLLDSFSSVSCYEKSIFNKCGIWNVLKSFWRRKLYIVNVTLTYKNDELNRH